MVRLAVKGDTELLEAIYANGTNGVNDALLQRYAGGFDKAVTQVFGAGKKYPELERELRLNASEFGTYKTYDISKKLDALRTLPKTEYDKQAKATLDTYNGFQKTEYNTLVARSRSAKQFEQFQTEKLYYPNIEWLHTRSAAPRELHLSYVGLVLPQEDPFWNENQPGNEWGCKCDWRTTDKNPTSRPAASETIPPAVGLDGNPAQTGELVTEKHPYFARNTNAPAWVSDKAVLRCPNEVVYTPRTTTGGSSYAEHLLVTGTQEAAENRLIASLLADNGYKEVTLLPQIYKAETGLRKRYFGLNYIEKHPTANPDALVNGSVLEFKSAGRRNLSKRVQEAAKKSDRVLLKVTEPMSDKELEQFIKGQWALEDRSNMKELLMYVNGDLKVFKRP